LPKLTTWRTDLLHRGVVEHGVQSAPIGSKKHPPRRRHLAGERGVQLDLGSVDHPKQFARSGHTYAAQMS